jgi:hypothetical protein
MRLLFVEIVVKADIISKLSWELAALARTRVPTNIWMSWPSHSMDTWTANVQETIENHLGVCTIESDTLLTRAAALIMKIAPANTLGVEIKDYLGVK